MPTSPESGRVRWAAATAAKDPHLQLPQGRVTDHRIGLTLYRIDAVLDGNWMVISTPRPPTRRRS